MKLAVIGLGLIGGSMAKDLRRTKFATEIIGVDSHPNNAKIALEVGLVDRIELLEKAVNEADIVLLAIPVDKIAQVLPMILNEISASTTVIDVGSTKREITEAVKDHPMRGNYVASHPMSGTENSGPTAALDHLFDNKICIICDHQNSRPQHLALAEKMFQALGMPIAYMSSDEQDHTTAFISHLPHATSFALANTVQAIEDRKIIFDLASGGFQSAVRLAKSSPQMWGPIFWQNRDYIFEALEAYIHHLEEFKKSLKNNDHEKLISLIENANNIRGILGGENSSLTKNEETIIKFYTK